LAKLLNAMENQRVYITNNVEETRQLGAMLAKLFKPGDIIGFQGDLGTGKTCLVQGICAALGAGQARSPSFTLVQEYQGKYPLCHIDIYRLQDPEELLDLGWEEMSNGENVIFIEWAERLKKLKITYAYFIKLEYGEKADSRKITIDHRL
jgi:tRNA threonylcarbamoyladenosine biosynthesis protein TsaE